jgi:hypothetical protein
VKRRRFKFATGLVYQSGATVLKKYLTVKHENENLAIAIGLTLVQVIVTVRDLPLHER